MSDLPGNVVRSREGLLKPVNTLADAAGEFGVMTVDEEGRVIAFDEKPENPNPIPGKPSINTGLFKTGFS